MYSFPGAAVTTSRKLGGLRQQAVIVSQESTSGLGGFTAVSQAWLTLAGVAGASAGHWQVGWGPRAAVTWLGSTGPLVLQEASAGFVSWG